MRLIDFPDASDLGREKSLLLDDGRHEATPGFPRLAERAEMTQPDPARVEFHAETQTSKRRLALGPIGSFCLHLLVLLAITEWPRAPAEIPRPIPIQLVIEQPPPSPQPAEPKPRATRPQGRRASDDFAEVQEAKIETPKGETGRSDQPPAGGEPPPPAAETRTVLVAPPSRPPTAVPLDPQASGERLPPATQTAMLVIPAAPRKAAPPAERATLRIPKPIESAWPLPLHPGSPKEARRSARLLGPAAIRDAYCAEAFRLTMRHIDLLPLSLTGARHGETLVSIRVLGDGTINSVRVARSSGYPDIDERIERMVVQVGRFPPLPDWMGPSMDFIFQLHFPDRLQR